LSAMGLVVEQPSKSFVPAGSLQHPKTPPDPLALLPEVNSPPHAAGRSPAPAAVLDGAHEEALSVERTVNRRVEAVPKPLQAPPVVVVRPPAAAVNVHPVAEEAKGKNIAADAPAENAGEFMLSGIMYDEKRPMAIINGRLVGVGQRVEGREIMAIHKDGVRLDGRRSFLRLQE